MDKQFVSAKHINMRMERILDEYELQQVRLARTNDGNNDGDAEKALSYMGIRISPDTSTLAYNVGKTSTKDDETPMKRTKRYSAVVSFNQWIFRKQRSTKQSAPRKSAGEQTPVRKQPKRASKVSSPYGGDGSTVASKKIKM